MKDNYFVDSNILIYAHTIQDERKKAVSQQILSFNDSVVLNTQVVNESINVFIRQFKATHNELNEILSEIFFYLSVSKIDNSTIESGVHIHFKYQFSYYDSLIIASALQNECSVLYSEDLHHNQKIEKTLTIINPFI